MKTIISATFLFCLFLLYPAESTAEPILWPSTPLAKHELRNVPNEQTPKTLAIAGAKGESVSAQAVYSPGTAIAAATCSISDLTNRESGAAIQSSAIRLNWVRYIPIQRNSPDIPADELEIKAPNCFPDPFWESGTIPISYGYLAIINNGLYIVCYSNPLWINIDIPRDARAGDYTGILTVTGDGEASMLPVTLHVWDFALPEKQHVSVINWCSLPLCPFKGELYEKEYWDVLSRDLKFLAANGQTDITHPGFDLIVKKGDGWDTALFEKWTETALAAGMRQFHLHGLGQGRTIAHLAYMSEINPLNPATVEKLAAVEEVLKRRGWNGRFIANICDEPFIMNEISYMERVAEIKKVAPGIRLIEAMEAEYMGDVDVYCPKLNHLNMWYPRFKELQDAGKEMWYYICLHPTGRYPNRFVDQSMLKHRVLFWIHYLYGLDGYLHWGGNFYQDENPYSEAGIGGNTLPLGDAAVWYPGEKGPVGSLRFTAQHDGLQDYGYLEVLENRVSALKERIGEKEAFWVQPRQRPLELTRRVIWGFHDYTRDPQILLDTRREIAEEIECLGDDFYLYVQTSPADRAVFPHGPRNLGIRGLVPPGAVVTVNGVKVENIRPSGYFLLYHFLLDGEPDVVIRADYKGRTRTITRSFTLTD